MTTASPQVGGARGLAPGAVVGGRFVVERVLAEDAMGARVAARDQRTQKAIALRLLSKGIIRDAASAERLRAYVRTAAAIPHKNLLAAFGAGSDPRAGWYVACEQPEGETVASLVARRRAEGLGGLSLRGAYGVFAQICDALAAASVKTVHGAVRPAVVYLTRAGRVKLGDLGVDRAVLEAAGAAAFGPEQAWLAPEVRAGAAPDAHADVFGAVAVFYHALTGRLPTEERLAPSKIVDGATVALDEILFTCLADDPAHRLESVEEARSAIAPLIADAPPEAPDDFVGSPRSLVPPAAGTADAAGATEEIEVDVHLPTSVAPPASPASPPEVNLPKAAALPALAVPPATVPPAPTGDATDRPRVGQRVSAGEQFRPSLEAPPPSAPVAVGGGAVPPGVQPSAASPGTMGPTTGAVAADVDLGALLAKITENDAPRWMVVKDGLDHGPFSGRELVQLILKGEVQDEHGLLNMDTGERRKVKQFPDFVEFLEQYKVRKREAEERAALARAEKVQKMGAAAKALIALAVLGVLGLAVGIFVATRPRTSAERTVEENLADLYERGEIQITGTAGILPPPPPRRGGSTGGGGSRGGMSYEEAMNQAVNLGDLSGGGERQLTPQDVAGVMNRNLNSLFSCVSQELRSGGNLGTVQIDLAIAGSGQVLGASVRQGSPAFQACIGAKARAIRFPSFPAPRMGARYTFSVD
jgi:hypothetical protein